MNTTQMCPLFGIVCCQVILNVRIFFIRAGIHLQKSLNFHCGWIRLKEIIIKKVQLICRTIKKCILSLKKQDLHELSFADLSAENSTENKSSRVSVVRPVRPVSVEQNFDVFILFSV